MPSGVEVCGAELGGGEDLMGDCDDVDDETRIGGEVDGRVHGVGDKGDEEAVA